MISWIFWAESATLKIDEFLPWAVGLRGCAEGFRVAGTGLFWVFGVESQAEADVRVAVAAAAPPPIAITIGSRLIDMSAISL